LGSTVEEKKNKQHIVSIQRWFIDPATLENTRRKLDFTDTSSTSSKRTLSQQFLDIIDKAKKSAGQLTMAKFDVDELENTVRDAFQVAVNPLEQRLAALTLKLDNQAEQNYGRFNPMTAGFLALKPPPSFSGAIGESFSGWLEKIKQYLILQGITEQNDEFRKAYLEANITGTAQAAFREMKQAENPPTTFEEITDALAEIFPENRDSDIHQQILYDKKQKPTESVVEYFAALNKLASFAYSNLEEAAKRDIIKPIFLRGLLPKIREHIRFKEFASLEEAVKAAIYIEAQLFREEIFISNNSVFTNSEKRSEMEDLKRQIAALTMQLNRQKPKIGCGKCGRNNHTDDECRASYTFKSLMRKPMGCDICHKRSHATEDCRAKCGNCGRVGHKTITCKYPRKQNGEFRYRQNFGTKPLNKKPFQQKSYINVIDLEDENLYEQYENKCTETNICVISDNCGCRFCVQHAPTIVAMLNAGQINEAVTSQPAGTSTQQQAVVVSQDCEMVQINQEKMDHKMAVEIEINQLEFDQAALEAQIKKCEKEKIPTKTLPNHLEKIQKQLEKKRAERGKPNRQNKKKKPQYYNLQPLSTMNNLAAKQKQQKQKSNKKLMSQKQHLVNVQPDVVSLVCLFLLLFCGNVQSHENKTFHICGASKSGHPIDVPKTISCIQPELSHTPSRMNLSLYVPREFPVNSTANKCTIRKRTVCSYMNIIGGKSILSDNTTIEHTDFLECNSVVNTKKYKSTKLEKNIHNIWSTNNKLNIEFNWCKTTCTSVTNYYIENG